MAPLALATLTALGYAGTCWVLPFGTCHRCHGTGHRPGHLGIRLRPCRRCKASGRRLRYGRRAYNYLHTVYTHQ